MAVGPEVAAVTLEVANAYRDRAIAKSKRGAPNDLNEPDHVHFQDSFAPPLMSIVDSPGASTVDPIPRRWNATVENMSPQAGTVEFGTHGHLTKTGHPAEAHHWMRDALMEMRAENGV